MAQYVKQGNIFGRIGSGIAKGLSEQVPKEIERARLASGLKALNEQHAKENLSPQEYFTRALGVPGLIERPQALQSLENLAKIQNQGNAYRNASGGVPQTAQGTNAQGVPEQGNQGQQLVNTVAQNAGAPIQVPALPPGAQVAPPQSQTPNVGRQEFGQPQAVPTNPLNDNTLTRNPWTPQQRNAKVSEYINSGFLPDQAKELAADDEARYLGESQANATRLKELQQRQVDARGALSRHLQAKLHKDDNTELSKDISGEMLINLERGMERDLRQNPNASVEDVANEWSRRGVELAKAKGQTEKLGETTGIESLFKGKENYNKLSAAQKAFAKADNQEEFYNLLRNSDFAMSPQGAASIAFPLSSKIKEDVSKFPKTPVKYRGFGEVPATARERDAHARKAAIQIENTGIKNNDSLLAIARALAAKDPYFDQQAFFEQLNEDQDQIGLNDRQRRELIEGPPAWIPHWGDFKYLP